MEEEQKVRRCIYCKKMLLDEKLPFCLRCRLEGRNMAGKIGSATIALIISGAQLIQVFGSSRDSKGKVPPNDRGI